MIALVLVTAVAILLDECDVEVVFLVVDDEVDVPLQPRTAWIELLRRHSLDSTHH